MDRQQSRRRILAGAVAIAGASAGCIGGGDTGGDDSSDSSIGNGADDSSSDQESDDNSSDEHPQLVEKGLFDDFSDLSLWNTIDGTLTSDPENGFAGGPSARIDVEDEHARAAIFREFDSPRDFTDLHPFLAMQTSKTIYPRLRLFDETGDFLELRTSVRADLSYQYFDFGIHDVEGDPDLTAIVEIQFIQYVGSGDTLQVWLGEFRFSARDVPGRILIHFDDTLETDYTEALPILSEHDMQASSFINPGYVGRTVAGSPRLSIDQLRSLDEAGWDIGNHGMYHNNLSNGDEELFQREIRDAHQWLVDHGFETGAGYFVYPYGSYDQNTLNVIQEDHEYAFGSGWQSVGRCGNPLLIPRAAGDPDFETARQVIDHAKTYGGTSTLFYHQLSGDQLEAFQSTISYLADIRDGGDIRVQTVSDVADTLTEDVP